MGGKNLETLHWTLQTGRCHASTLSSCVWTRTTTPRRHSCARGRSSNAPTFTAPVRDTHADEIYVASILVQPGAVKILQADITDLRMDENLQALCATGSRVSPLRSWEQAQQLIEQLRTELQGVKDQTGLMLKCVYDADNNGKWICTEKHFSEVSLCRSRYL